MPRTAIFAVSRSFLRLLLVATRRLRVLSPATLCAAPRISRPVIADDDPFPCALYHRAALAGYPT